MQQSMSDLPSSISKALALLRAVTIADAPPNFSCLLKTTDLPKATLHRLLQELIDAGLIQCSAHDRCYRPAVGLLELSYRAWEGLDLRQTAARHLDTLWHSTNETVHLAVRDDLDIIYIDKRESPKTLRLFSSIGRRGPIYCTGVGKAILAHLEPALRMQVIERLKLRGHTKQTITSRAALLLALEDIRASGVALDCGEHEDGIGCVAAPIFDRNNRVIAGISVTAPSMRMDQARMTALAPEVCEAARAISRDVTLSNCSV
jgi:DNA-binding IclR family transcriptional regulator